MMVIKYLLAVEEEISHLFWYKKYKIPAAYFTCNLESTLCRNPL